MKNIEFVCCFANCTLQNRGKDRKFISYTQARGAVRMLFIQKTSIITQKRAPEGALCRGLTPRTCT